MCKNLKNSTMGVLSMVLFGLFVMYGCERLVPISNPSTDDITVSKCKLEKSNDDADDMDDAEIETNIIYKDKRLYLEHKDIYFNCALQGVDVTTVIIGDTIEVNIKGIVGEIQVSCLCPVDVSYSIGDFEDGTYTLVIKVHDQQIYTQTVHF